MTGGQRDEGQGKAASAVLYLMLGGFAAVASGISARGLTGFARSNMGLVGPWPYLLFFALDGAAGVCAVLLARRVARADGSMAPRLAVWGLVTASAAFNYTHAPRHPDAAEAYALMPVIAAVLFEFCLQETRLKARSRDRKLSVVRWLHPAERVRVRMLMAADGQESAGSATRQVRARRAARRLYELRIALQAHGQQGSTAPRARYARKAERRAQAALAHARFTDPDMAAEVLRQVQVLTMTPALAMLDFTTPRAARAAIGSLITPAMADDGNGEFPAPDSVPEAGDGPAAEAAVPVTVPVGAIDGPAAAVVPAGAGHADADADAGFPAEPPGEACPAGPGGGSASDHDAPLIDAASRIVAEAAQNGISISQTALAARLRSQGRKVANDKLNWLLAAAADHASRDG